MDINISTLHFLPNFKGTPDVTLKGFITPRFVFVGRSTGGEPTKNTTLQKRRIFTRSIK